ncbi:MAG TPA: Vps62-related protein [Polyangiaceae bacterium]|nr:Vps62-related protein [Polyangiaceae bacterium]
MAPYGKNLFSLAARLVTPLAFVALGAHCGGSGDEPAGAAGDGSVPRGDSASGGGAGSPNQAGWGGNPVNAGSGGSGPPAGGAGPGGAGGGGGAGPGGAGGEGGGLTGLDDDADGIDDGLETTLARRFAPLLRLTANEQYRPGSVAWYLPRVHLRFNHDNCFDHEILALGEVTADNLGQQSHPNNGSLCQHSGDAEDQLPSNAKHLEFFLQPPDDAAHGGAPPADWRAYAHVKKSQTIAGGYDVQYWFFYPFNSTIANFDHEADWEHITVVADASEAIAQARYAAHSGGTTHPASALELVPGTSRPVGYVALGSHATYNKPGEYLTEAPDFVFTDQADGEGPEFDTSVGLVNVGERGKPLNGQAWVNYGGRWGEIGEFSNTSGPPGPAFQGAWDAL